MLYDTKWIILPIDTQKAIMLLLHGKQNAKGLRFGSLRTALNREFFKLVNLANTFTLTSGVE